jgi:two-component system NtrC family response regulator
MSNLTTVSSPVATAPVAAPPPNNLDILVVEDEAVIRDLFALILNNHGYRIRQAKGGHEACRLIAAERPALILSDLHMPQGDGWELLDYCRSHAPDVPVILCSGSGFGTRPQVEAWAAGRITKPFSPEQLTSAVERILSRAPARTLNQTGRAA